MRDFKKYSRPKVTKYPKFGDVGVKLKYGSSVFVKIRDFLNVKKFFKVNSIYGEEPTISYGVKALYKTLNKEIIVSVDTYESNKDKLLFIEYIGEQQDGPSPDSGDEHEYVEIGGVKWATMNVGANTVTEYGLYFQWGDTQGYTTSQVGDGEGLKYFDWKGYKYAVDPNGSNGSGSGSGSGGGIYKMTKYNETDGKSVLEASDDAVTAAWGGSWRMPTAEEFEALENAVNTAWTNDYQGSGISGLVLTDKTDSSKVLFFPAAGNCSNGSVNNVGSDGLYWSSSLYSSDVQCGHNMFFLSGDVNWQDYSNRYNGFAVRGVCD